jgi:hypothetical protein
MKMISWTHVLASLRPSINHQIREGGLRLMVKNQQEPRFNIFTSHLNNYTQLYTIEIWCQTIAWVLTQLITMWTLSTILWGTPHQPLKAPINHTNKRYCLLSKWLMWPGDPGMLRLTMPNVWVLAQGSLIKPTVQWAVTVEVVAVVLIKWSRLSISQTSDLEGLLKKV